MTIINPLYRIYAIITLAFSGLFLSSCSEDFELTEPWKDIPVMYAMLNRFDTAQYVRIEKAFVSEDLAAAEIAKNPDSLYYKSAVVTLVNKTANKSYIMTKVDASKENYIRQEGDFATTPNFLYKVKTKDIILRSQDDIVIELDRGDGSKIVSSQIKMIKDVRLYEFDTLIRELGFDPTLNQTYTWLPGSDAQVFNFRLNIQVEERNLTDGSRIRKNFSTIILSNGIEKNATINGKVFYDLLANNLTANPEISRSILNVSLDLKSGSKELRDFLTIVNANTGLTASQEIPRYSNISEGFGIVYSTCFWIKNYSVSPKTINFLRTLDQTKDLNF
jgi:hypothetical protein